MSTPTVRTVTPGGALLRASRVFAIPPALPRPTPQLSTRAVYNSESATLQHPIRLSITTPQTSLMRGDWGLKRPLPLRSTTKSSTPLIRVEAIDTYEHITEYASAADHTLNLQKWHEMGVPLTVPVVDDRAKLGGFKSGKRQSVFEDKIDYTTTPVNIGGRDDIRWKFKGPYLSDQTEGAFTDYVTTEVRKRRLEFQEYLRNACATELTARARRAAVDEVPAAIDPEEITLKQLTAYIKQLRGDRPTLYKHVRAFLDLAPVAVDTRYSNPEALTSLLTIGFNQPSTNDEFAQTLSPYAQSGPPKTHPSAGLSYTRSSAYTVNHPDHGPQKKSTTLNSRIIKPRGAASGTFEATLGVAGFVTPLPAGSDSFSTGRSKYSKETGGIAGVTSIEPNKVGGSKVHVHPTHATISSTGQVMLVVESADQEAIAVLENTTHLIPEAKKPLPQRPRMMGPNGVFGGGYGLGPERKQEETPFGARPISNPVDLNKSLNGLLDIE